MVVERIVFQDDATFEATRRDFVASDERTSRDDLRDMFRAASATPKRGDAAFEATRRETIAFSSEEPIVEKFRALFVVAPDVKRFETQFELAKISAGRSIFISFEARRGSETSSPGASRFEFDGVRSPTPGKFAARFFPIFSVSSDESWFSGRVVASDAPEFGADVFGPPSTLPSSSVASNANADEPPFLQSPESVWTTRLDDCRFYGVDVATLADKLELPRFTGSVSEFCVRDGAIRRGVFLGSGFLKILKGSIPQSILSRACAAKRLEVSPPSTLSLRFADDAVPFAEFESLFEARREGIAFDSRYPNKIIAYYRGVDVEYGVFLPKDAAGRIVSYSEAVASLLGTENVRDFWSPFFREALNHLPIDAAASVSPEPPTESEERREISVPFH